MQHGNGRWTRIIVLAFGFAGFKWISPEVALGQTPNGAAATSAEKVAFKKCKEAAAANNHADAVECFRRALLTYDNPSQWVRLGRSLEALKRYPEARQAFAKVAVLQRGSGTSATDTAIDAAQADLAALEGKVATLRVDGVPPGMAIIQIDGVTHAPDAAGEVVVEAEKKKSKIRILRRDASAATPPLWESDGELRGGERYRIMLVPQPVAPTPQPLSTSTASAPVPGAPPPPPTGQVWPLPPPVQLPPPPPLLPPGTQTPAPSIVMYSLGGLGIAGVTAGIAMGIAALGTRESLLGQCKGTTCPPQSEPLKHNAVGLAIGATAALATGTACLGAAVVVHLTERRSPAASATATVPGLASRMGVTIGVGSIGIQGEF